MLLSFSKELVHERGKSVIFQKQKKTMALDLQQYSVTMDVPNSRTLVKQIEMLNLTKQDLQYLKAFKPFVEDNINHIVDRFYAMVGTEQSLVNIINKHSSVDKLKITLRRHIIEMFNGTIDEEFYRRRADASNHHPTHFYHPAG